VIEEAVAAFRRDIDARKVREPAKRKFQALLGERLLDFARKQGYPRLEDPNLHAVTEFRVTWDSPRPRIACEDPYLGNRSPLC